MKLRSSPFPSFATLDGEVAARALALTSDIAVLIQDDGEGGLVLDVMLPQGGTLAREIAGWSSWRGRRWRDLVLPEAVPTADTMLREATITAHARPQARVVTHPAAGMAVGQGVEVLYTAMRLRGSEGAVLLVGRDLLGQDLVSLMLAHDPAVTRAYVATLRARGMDGQALCLDILAPAARRLGMLWAEDRCDFTQVTEGVGRLQEALRSLAPPQEPAEGPLVLLAPVPGEQHGFGLLLVGAFLGWAGMRVLAAAPASEAALVSMVQGEEVDVVGLSVGCESQLPAAESAIRAIRRAMPQGRGRRRLGVMVGGRVIAQDPGLARRLGADAAAIDAQHVVPVVRQLLGWKRPVGAVAAEA